MQHHPPPGGGGGGGDHHHLPPPFNDPNPADDHHQLGDLGIAEAASPISSRPPAIATSNFEDMMQDAGGGSSGNRWPRQETLALIQIRSEMDAAFRDATPKAPLWEQISRKMGALGYQRSAKKCKEKFENVHKYYKRTKEGRAGRQYGKSYKFFTQLEALDHHMNIASPSSINPTLLPPPPPSLPPHIPRTEPPSFPPQEPVGAGASTSFFGNVGISFSSNTSSEGEDDDEDDIGDYDLEMEPDRPVHDRKRKRTADHDHQHHHHGVNSDERMMEFFQGLMSKVMAKQEAMQQKFLEAIEKREQDRMIREEAWKRQDMARISREHDLLSHERAISASRDAAIITFLEKITGQTINLPISAPIPPPPQNPIPPPPQPPAPAAPPQPQIESHPLIDSPRAGAPEQQTVPLQEAASSSRWPKAEVLALIQLRSGMEFKYQEVGPKGPLWEEVSIGMQKLGYSRNPKRCKEKWENINKYYKKVKESNKKRPEDSKTCPYFHELEALYQRKLNRNNSTTSIQGTSSEHQQQQQQQQQPQQGGNEGGSSKQPEDMMLERKQEGHEDLIDIDCFNAVECSSYSDEEDINQEDQEEYNYDDHTKDMDMYKIQFQKMNNVGGTKTTGGGGGTGAGSTTTASFMAMVQ